MRRSVSRITRQARSSSTTSTVEPRRSSGVGAIGLGGVNGTEFSGSISVAMPRPPRRTTRSHAPTRPVKRTRPLAAAAPRPRAGGGPSAKALITELGSCVTEADLIQVLYRALQPRFGYDAINLQVLDREGCYPSLPIDAGVLQDVRRRPLRESTFAKQFENPEIAVLP